MNNLPLLAVIPPAKPCDLENFFGQLLPAEGAWWMLMLTRGSKRWHESFDNIESIISRVKELEQDGSTEIYHAVASFNHHHDTVKGNDAQRWGRKSENVAYVSAFFLDIDVAIDKPGKAYGSLNQAEQALARFGEALGIPHNYLVHSGSGLHVYWFLDVDLPRDEWRRISLKLKDAAKVAGLLADPSRTSDPASVLRPVGTTNRKERYGPAGRLVQGRWCRFGRVNVDEFEVACNRVIDSHIQSIASGNASPTSAVAMAPTRGPHWFDGLADDVKVLVLQSMLGKIPAGDIKDRTVWLSVGAALSGVTGVDREVLFALWAEWSQSTDEGATSWREDSPEEQRRRWEGLNRSGVGALITRAKAAGWQPEALREEAEGDLARAAVLKAQDGVGDRWTLAEAEAYMREHVLYVRTDNTYLLHGLPLLRDALDISLARHMPISDRQITASGLFKKGAGVIVDHVGYKPGEAITYEDRNGRTIANTWREHRIVPKDPTREDAQALADFVRHLANGDEETKDGIKQILLKFVFLFKNPSARIRHVTLLVGRSEGCGKTTLTHDIPVALFGGENVRNVETRELGSNFNGYAQGARILVFSELWLGTRKDALSQANNLKPLITDDHIPLVKKGKDGRTIENFTTIFASSNYGDAAILGEFDRRYHVISTGAPIMPRDIAVRIHSLIRNRPGALLSLLLRLYGRQADSFDPNAPPPHTVAKKSMVESGRGVWAQRIRDAFEAREWPFKGDMVAVPDVRVFLARDGGQLPSDKAIRGELLNLSGGAYSVQAQRRQGANTQQKRVVVLRNIEAWRDAGPSALYDHYYDAVIKPPHERVTS